MLELIIDAYVIMFSAMVLFSFFSLFLLMICGPFDYKDDNEKNEEEINLDNKLMYGSDTSGSDNDDNISTPSSEDSSNLNIMSDTYKGNKKFD
jgi:hypothetical protein